MDPKVSIVLTSYNQKQRLKKAFESLLNQTYKNLEIIIVDDDSQDGSKEIILDWKEKYSSVVKYNFQRKNVGIPNNKNTGFKLASGDFITYLDGDDCYLSSKIAAEVKYFENHPEVDVVFSNFFLENEATGKRELWDIKGKTLKTSHLFQRIISRSFPHGIVFRCEMWNKQVLEAIGYYDENLAAFHDWDSRIRYSKTFKIGYCPNKGFVYNLNESGISQKLSKSDLHQEFHSVLKKNAHLWSDLDLMDKFLLTRNIDKTVKWQLLHDKNYSNQFRKFLAYAKYLFLYPEQLKIFYWSFKKINSLR